MSVISNRRINDYLDSWGVAHANKGFRYLMVGIRLLLDEKADRSAVMELYDLIGNACGTNGSLVERAIRESIKSSKARGMPNREFFARAVDTLVFLDEDQNEITKENVLNTET